MQFKGGFAPIDLRTIRKDEEADLDKISYTQKATTPEGVSQRWNAGMLEYFLGTSTVLEFRSVFVYNRNGIRDMHSCVRLDQALGNLICLCVCVHGRGVGLGDL